jgi:NAD-dependent dihydropyrimidine dehydrogenase PreA subunit
MYENQIIPYIVAKYFIEKAGTILLIDCPCRTKNGCKNHDVSLGCTWMGKGASKVDRSKWPGARLATKEEALQRERLAYENGLVPHFGKLRSDAALYDVLDYEDEFMDICHCCSCCCVVALAKYGPKNFKKIIQRMEGIEVKIDPEKCKGCGECFKVCIYDGFRMKDSKASIKQDNCMGCGRCELVCKTGAIKISITDYSGIDKLIARFDERVDISG